MAPGVLPLHLVVLDRSWQAEPELDAFALLSWRFGPYGISTLGENLGDTANRPERLVAESYLCACPSGKWHTLQVYDFTRRSGIDGSVLGRRGNEHREFCLRIRSHPLGSHLPQRCFRTTRFQVLPNS